MRHRFKPRARAGLDPFCRRWWESCRRRLAGLVGVLVYKPARQRLVERQNALVLDRVPCHRRDLTFTPSRFMRRHLG